MLLRFAPTTGVLAVMAALALAGCADMGNIKPQSHTLPANSLKAGAAIHAAQPAAWPTEAWWEALGDAQLNKLVESAIADSPTLKVAEARVRQAEAVAGIYKAVTLPRVDASASSTRQQFPTHGSVPPPLAGNWAWYNSATVTASHDLDLWGRNRDLWAAALDDTQVASAEAQASRLTLETAVVRTYIQLWYDYRLLDSVRDSLKQRETILDITRRRHSAGLASAIDVTTVETTLPAGRRQEEQIEESIALLRNQLAALIGKGPGDGDTISRPALTLNAATGLPSSLPAELVGRRPDLTAQRWRVESASYGIEASKAAFYPNINIVAFAGLQSFGFSRFLQADALTRGISPAISLPIFEGGRLRSQLGAQTAAYDAAVEQYNGTLVHALLEVANTVTQMQSVEAQQKLAEEALATARRSHDLAYRSFRAGITDSVTVLSARLTQLGEEEQLAKVEMERLDNYASLMSALGGGLKMSLP
jgi:NodT family efflux transporter outer membrane factor (OMF) lipoprotein